MDAFEKQIVAARLNKIRYEDGTYAVGGAFLTQHPLSYKGIGPSKGKVVIQKQSIISAELCINGYPIKYENKEVIYNEKGTTCNQDIVFEDESLTNHNKMKETKTQPANDGEGFYGSTIQRKNVERIVVTNTNEVPNNAIERLDVSEKGNGSVMAWFLDTDGNGKYELYIGQKEKVVLSSGLNLFYHFTNVKSMDLTYLDTSAVTDMSYMFGYCIYLKSLDISHFDTSHVTKMTNMFSACSSLTSLNLDQFDTSEVISMEGMFSNCYSLKELDLRHFNTSKVTNMSAMFSDCYELRSLDLSYFDTSKVTNMTSMFGYCQYLETLILGRFDISKVTNYPEMFCDSYSLTTVKTTNATTKTWLEARLDENELTATVVLGS